MESPPNGSEYLLHLYLFRPISPSSWKAGLRQSPITSSSSGFDLRTWDWRRTTTITCSSNWMSSTAAPVSLANEAACLVWNHICIPSCHRVQERDGAWYFHNMINMMHGVATQRKWISFCTYTFSDPYHRPREKLNYDNPITSSSSGFDLRTWDWRRTTTTTCSSTAVPVSLANEAACLVWHYICIPSSHRVQERDGAWYFHNMVNMVC